MPIKLNIQTPSNDRDSYDMKQFERRSCSIEELLIYATETNCSDLYIKEFTSPYISRFGKLVRLPCNPTSREEWMNFYDKYIREELNASYVREKMLDTSVEIRIPDDSPLFDKYPSAYFRYRLSLGFSTDARTATFRMIRPEKPTFATINYPESCRDALTSAFAKKTGIIYFTGPTGSGKTTTLVACMNDFTQPGKILDNKAIISLEEPIEYSFDSTDTVKFTQKEMGKDFISYDNGIKQALREHPNMINVGECRDREVIGAAIEAARTGHLVATSFHASDCAGTLSRLSYHLGNDTNLIYDLILNMNIIMSQKLIPQNDRYKVDTQYVLFTDEVTQRIVKAFSENKNISIEVNELFKDENLVNNGIVKDWD